MTVTARNANERLVLDFFDALSSGDPKAHVQNMFSEGPWVCVEAMREYMDRHYTANLFGMD